MEELLVYSILIYEKLVTEQEYRKRLDELFLDDPENDILLKLEWETSLEKTILDISAQVDCESFDVEQFGRILMDKLQLVYETCSDINEFASRMYHLWQSLPGSLQHVEPFWRFSYADDPLSWGDEKQTRDIYEGIFHYYREEQSI